LTAAHIPQQAKQHIVKKEKIHKDDARAISSVIVQCMGDIVSKTDLTHKLV